LRMSVISILWGVIPVTPQFLIVGLKRRNLSKSRINKRQINSSMTDSADERLDRTTYGLFEQHIPIRKIMSDRIGFMQSRSSKPSPLGMPAWTPQGSKRNCGSVMRPECRWRIDPTMGFRSPVRGIWVTTRLSETISGSWRGSDHINAVELIGIQRDGDREIPRGSVRNRVQYLRNLDTMHQQRTPGPSLTLLPSIFTLLRDEACHKPYFNAMDILFPLIWTVNNGIRKFRRPRFQVSFWTTWLKIILCTHVLSPLNLN
jgi:hypothetical protein